MILFLCADFLFLRFLLIFLVHIVVKLLNLKPCLKKKKKFEVRKKSFDKIFVVELTIISSIGKIDDSGFNNNRIIS